MKWIKPQKDKSKQPAQGGYIDWKEQISAECSNQCVYCAIHENKYGGVRNFHIDHYRPKSIYGNLIDDIMNLFLSCSICNVFKSDDWPNEPNEKFDIPFYPNPCDVDYNSIFISDNSGFIKGCNISSRYMIEKLFLNRPQLIFIRKENQLVQRIDSIQRFFSRLLELFKEKKDDELKNYIIQFADLITKINIMKSELGQIRMYSSTDTKRKK